MASAIPTLRRLNELFYATGFGTPIGSSLRYLSPNGTDAGPAGVMELQGKGQYAVVVTVDGTKYLAADIVKALLNPAQTLAQEAANIIPEVSVPNLNSIGAIQRQNIQVASLKYNALAARYSSNAADLTADELASHTAAAQALVNALSAAGLSAKAGSNG